MMKVEEMIAEMEWLRASISRIESIMYAQGIAISNAERQLEKLGGQTRAVSRGHAIAIDEIKKLIAPFVIPESEKHDD